MVWRAECAAWRQIVHAGACRVWWRKVCVLMIVPIRGWWCIVWLKQWNGIWTLKAIGWSVGVAFSWNTGQNFSTFNFQSSSTPITFNSNFNSFILCAHFCFHIDLDHRNIILDTIFPSLFFVLLFFHAPSRNTFSISRLASSAHKFRATFFFQPPPDTIRPQESFLLSCSIWWTDWTCVQHHSWKVQPETRNQNKIETNFSSKDESKQNMKWNARKAP